MQEILIRSTSGVLSDEDVHEVRDYDFENIGELCCSWRLMKKDFTGLFVYVRLKIA